MRLNLERKQQKHRTLNVDRLILLIRRQIKKVRSNNLLSTRNMPYNQSGRIQYQYTKITSIFMHK
jgi:hypothetical protein